MRAFINCSFTTGEKIMTDQEIEDFIQNSILKNIELQIQVKNLKEDIKELLTKEK